MAFAMRFTFLLVATSCIAEASLSLVDLHAPSLTSHHSNLRAAKRHRDTFIRNNGFLIGQEIELVYAEHYTGGPIISSHIQLQANQPTLLLEDFDHHLREVTCSDSQMVVAFQSMDVYWNARDACGGLIGGLLVSSHHSCGDDGAHTVYRVMDVTFDNASFQIMFDLVESSVEAEFSTATIEFGHTDNQYAIHRHDRLARRMPQAAATTPTGVGRPTGINPSTVTQSVVAQTTDTFNRTDLGFQRINTIFFQDSTLEKLNPIHLGCANCSAKGEMITTSGKIQLDFGAWFSGEDNDPVKAGFMQIEIQGFEMSIGLKATPSIPIEKDYDLAEVSPVGFNIPKIGRFGITIALAAFVKLQIKGGVELGFGFDVKVPNSRAYLDISELDKSAITGFDGTQLSLKPLTANASDLEFSLEAGLRPKITAGLKFLGLAFDGGPYVSLPSLNMSVTRLATDSVGANCEAGGASDVGFRNAFRNLTHVGYGLGIAAGLGLQLGLLDVSRDLWTKPLLNATQCLAFRTAGKALGLAPATAVLQEMTHTPAPSGAKKSGAAGRRGLDFEVGVWVVVLGVVPAVVAVLL